MDGRCKFSLRISPNDKRASRHIYDKAHYRIANVCHFGGGNFPALPHGYPQRRDLGEEVVMPKSFYDLATDVGMDEFSQDFLKIFMSALSRPGNFCLPAKSYFSGKLDQQVFTIDYAIQAVVPKTYRELFHLVDQSSRPAGSGTKYFATPTGSESQPWAVGYYTGSCEKLFQFFETEDEAISAVEDMWIDDIWNQSDFSVYATLEEAQESLAETL